MNLQQTINELEQKAADYTQAANSLRALLPHENTNGTSGVGRKQTTPSAQTPSSTRIGGGKGTAKNTSPAKTAGKRAPMSAEARAKIAAAVKARHAQRRSQGS